MPLPLVSVIVPSYNMAKFLPDSIRSVTDQTWTNWELIVVDDGSTDGTAELLSKAARKDRRLKVVATPNEGLSAARNNGLKRAGGDMVCFLDADDAFVEDKLEKQVQFLCRHPGCGLVYSDHYVGDELLRPLRVERKRPPLEPLAELLLYRNWFAPLAPLLRMTMARAVGFFDETLRSSEDWDYWIRACRCGEAEYLPGPVGVYRTHAMQMHRNRERMNASQRAVLDKNYPQGTRQWRAAHAALAWSEGKAYWAAYAHLRAAKSLLKAALMARSRDVFSRVMTLAEH